MTTMKERRACSELETEKKYGFKPKAGGCMIPALQALVISFVLLCVLGLVWKALGLS